MNEQKSDTQFENDIKLELDRSCDRLDAHTLSRLNQIRHQAIEGATRPAFFQRPLFTSGLLTTCALVLAIGVYVNSSTTNELDIDIADIDDIEILSTDDNFELYEEIEFYQWLSMNDGF